jgi:hypothetical protein
VSKVEPRQEGTNTYLICIVDVNNQFKTLQYSEPGAARAKGLGVDPPQVGFSLEMELFKVLRTLMEDFKQILHVCRLNSELKDL